jgi:hypothetical protein
LQKLGLRANVFHQFGDSLSKEALEGSRFNRTKDKTVAEFWKTVVATAPFLMPILVPVVSVTLRNSGTNTKGTKIGIKNGAVATTV